jgi:hypothetical protein
MTEKTLALKIDDGDQPKISIKGFEPSRFFIGRLIRKIIT